MKIVPFVIHLVLRAIFAPLKGARKFSLSLRYLIKHIPATITASKIENALSFVSHDRFQCRYSLRPGIFSTASDFAVNLFLRLGSPFKTIVSALLP